MEGARQERTVNDIYDVLIKVVNRLARLEQLQGFHTEALVRRQLFGDAKGLLVDGLSSLAAALVRHANAAPGGLLDQFIARVAPSEPDARQAQICLHVASVLLRSGAVASVGFRAVGVLHSLVSESAWPTEPQGLRSLRAALTALVSGTTAPAPPPEGAPAAAAELDARGADSKALAGGADEALAAADAAADAAAGPDAPGPDAPAAGAARRAATCTAAYGCDALRRVTRAALALSGTFKAEQVQLSKPQKDRVRAISALGEVLRRFCAWLQAARLPALAAREVMAEEGAGAATTALAFHRDSPAVAVLAYLATRVDETQSAPSSPGEAQADADAAAGAAGGAAGVRPAAAGAPAPAAAGGSSSTATVPAGSFRLTPVWRAQLEVDVCGQVAVLGRGVERMPAVRVDTGEIKTSGNHAAAGVKQGLIASAVQALAVLCLAAPAPSPPSGAPESPRHKVLSLRALLCALYPHDATLAGRAGGPAEPLVQLSTTVAIAQRAPRQRSASGGVGPPAQTQVASGGLVLLSHTYRHAGAYALPYAAGGGADGASTDDDADTDDGAADQ